MKKTFVFAIAMLISCVACGGGSSPTAPSPPVSTPPVAAPPPAPPPVVPTLSFQAEGVPSYPNIFHLSDRGETTPGQVAVDVNARFVNRGVDDVQGTILYETRLLEYVNFTEGDWMKQGGALAQFSVTRTTGGVAIRVQRASTAATTAGGSGVILTLRFRPAQGVTSGDSAMQWTEAYALVLRNTNQLVGAFGGTLHIR
jgi:hypothetical protein